MAAKAVSLAKSLKVSFTIKGKTHSAVVIKMASMLFLFLCWYIFVRKSINWLFYTISLGALPARLLAGVPSGLLTSSFAAFERSGRYVGPA